MSKQYEVITGPVYFRVGGSMKELTLGDVIMLNEDAASGLIKRGWVKLKSQPRAKAKPKFQPKQKQEGE